MIGTRPAWARNHGTSAVQGSGSSRVLVCPVSSGGGPGSRGIGVAASRARADMNRPILAGNGLQPIGVAAQQHEVAGVESDLEIGEQLAALVELLCQSHGIAGTEQVAMMR